MMRIFLLCLFSPALFALDFNDKLSANILDIYRNQFIRVDRGGEDGIDRGDVARLLTSSEAIGKGICTIVESKYSIWYVYKQYSPFDQIEPLMMYYRGNRQVPIAPRILVESDLVAIKSHIEVKEQQRMEYIASDAALYSEDYGRKFKRKETGPYFDRQGWKVFAEAAPFSMASDSDQLSYYFSGRVQRTGKHNLNLEMAQSAHSFTNEYTHEQSQATRTNGQFSYEITDFYRPQYSYYAMVDYDNKVGEDYAPVQHHVVAGALGIKHTFSYRTTHLQSLHVSYVPSFDYLMRDRLNSDGSVLSTSESTFRHAFRLGAKFRLYEDQVWLYNDFSLMPAQEISTLALDMNNLYSNNKLRLEIKLGKYFGLNYLNELVYSRHLDISAQSPQLALRQAITLRFDAAL